MNCRHCENNLKNTFIDLGTSPLANSFLSFESCQMPETYYPLKVMVCESCWLVQTVDFIPAESIFTSNYAYFSSVSSKWLEHSTNFSVKIIEELKLNNDSMVIEIGSNDGYLLKNFIARSIPCIGIEPTLNTADIAERRGIKVIKKFFSENLASEIKSENITASLVVGNNVYAHVPDINDFTRGLKKILRNDGTIVLEFPHLLNLIKYCQFDTIYHEHFSYLSLITVTRIFKSCGLRIYRVEQIETHGGSLRIFGCHEDDTRITEDSVYSLLSEESNYGLDRLSTYNNFKSDVNKIKNELLNFLISSNNLGSSVVAYGAAAKGNTLLNYCGIKSDLVSNIFDASPAKQGLYAPGSRIEIKPSVELAELKPDFILILAWNLEKEITGEFVRLKEYGTKFIIAIPELRIV